MAAPQDRPLATTLSTSVGALPDSSSVLRASSCAVVAWLTQRSSTMSSARGADSRGVDGAAAHGEGHQPQ